MTFIDEYLGWIITGGLIGIFVLVWRVSVKIEHRITKVEDIIANLENNPLFTGWRDFQNLQARRIFDPNNELRRWEEQRRNDLPEE
jgi:hypothetical protein